MPMAMEEVKFANSALSLRGFSRLIGVCRNGILLYSTPHSTKLAGKRRQLIMAVVNSEALAEVDLYDDLEDPFFPVEQDSSSNQVTVQLSELVVLCVSYNSSLTAVPQPFHKYSSFNHQRGAGWTHGAGREPLLWSVC